MYLSEHNFRNTLNAYDTSLTKSYYIHKTEDYAVTKTTFYN